MVKRRPGCLQRASSRLNADWYSTAWIACSAQTRSCSSSYVNGYYKKLDHLKHTHDHLTLYYMLTRVFNKRQKRNNCSVYYILAMAMAMASTYLRT